MVERAVQTSRDREPGVIGVKVFSVTKARDRDLLGDVITHWIREHRDFELVDKVVTQSSDTEFHCLTITLFYRQPPPIAT